MLDQLGIDMRGTEYGLVCLAETHLDNSVPSATIFDLDDEIIYRKDRNSSF